MKGALIAAIVVVALSTTGMARADEECSKAYSADMKLSNDMYTMHTLSIMAEDMKKIRELLEESAIRPDQAANILNRREADAKEKLLIKAKRAQRQAEKTDANVN